MADANVLRDARRSPVLLDRLLSDERLARRCAEGDVNAFSVLYERHHQALYRYCRSIVRDPEDAADALQSAMTKALAGIGGRDPRAPLRAWLFRITHNESISLLRRRSTTAAEALDPERLLGPDVEATAERREALAQLVRDLHSLPERQRGALLMREVGGLSHGEIAAAFGVSAGAVKQSIFEARTALHDEAAGREMSCDTVQRALSDGDGRTARQRRIRGHLRQCEECAGFQSALRARQADLRAVTPLLPAGSAAAILSGIVGGGGGGLVATLLGGGGASSALAKGAAVSAVAVTVGAGALGVTVLPDRQDRDLGAALQSRDAEGAERGDDGGGAGAVTVAEAAPRPPGGADGRHSGPGAGRDDEAEDRSGRRGDDDAPDDRSGRRDGGDDDDDNSGPGPGARADDPDDHSGPGPGTGEREDRSGPGGGDRLSEDRSGPGGGGDDGVDDHSGPGGGGDTVALAEPDNSGPGGGDDTPDLLETDNSGPGGGGDDVVEVDNSGSGSDSSGSGSSGSGSSDSGVSGD